MKIIRQTEHWDRVSVKEDADHYYIFGDNEKGKGTAGQACIRGLENAFGIPTKKSASEFWSDENYNNNVDAIENAIAKIPTDKDWVISHDGLGTGLANLPNKAPKTYRYLVGRITSLECEGYTLPPDKILVMRSCTFKRTGQHTDGGARDFVYPERGYIKCPDWSPRQTCGNGLHGQIWGQGYVYDSSEMFQVLEIDENPILLEDFKCKFREAFVLYTGSSEFAARMIRSVAPTGVAVSYSRNIGGENSRNTGGNDSHNTGGDKSHNSGGYGSHNIGGENSHNSGGNYSHNIGGENSHNSGGNYSHNIGGENSHNSGGYGSHNIGGENSHNIGGVLSHNSGGNDSHNIGGTHSHNAGGECSVCRSIGQSRMSAGFGGVLQMAIWDSLSMRYFGYSANVGEVHDGIFIEPDVFYTVKDCKWVKSDDQSPVEVPSKVKSGEAT